MAEPISKVAGYDVDACAYKHLLAISIICQNILIIICHKKHVFLSIAPAKQ
jgi:hypothetical protein